MADRGQISTSVKPSLEDLNRGHGKDQALAVRQEGSAALNWIEAFVDGEGIDCDFRRSGRFHAAHTTRHNEDLVRKIELSAILAVSSITTVLHQTGPVLSLAFESSTRAIIS